MMITTTQAARDNAQRSQLTQLIGRYIAESGRSYEQLGPILGIYCIDLERIVRGYTGGHTLGELSILARKLQRLVHG